MIIDSKYLIAKPRRGVIILTMLFHPYGICDLMNFFYNPNIPMGLDFL